MERGSTGCNRKEAAYYQALPKQQVQCCLCPRECLIPCGGLGFCKVRANRGGKLFALNYGWLRSLSLERIERVPLIDFYQGMGVLSVGSCGCNMTCPTCSSWQLVEGFGSGKALYPQEIVQIAENLLDKDCVGVAYSFGEPLVWYEHILECAKLLKVRDMKNMLSTNGIINKEPLLALMPYLDAVNLDIKSMDELYYQQALQAPLATVLENAVLFREYDVHLEISNLLIAGVNDAPDDIRKLALFMKKHLGKEVPLQFWSALPNGKVNLKPVSQDTLLMAAAIAAEYLTNVYVGTPLGRD